MTRRPRATRPPRQCTVTLSEVCSISSRANLEHDVVGDQGRESARDLARSADEPRGLGAALGLGEELGGHAAGLNGEQQMQEGHLGGGHCEDPDGADLQQVAGDDRKPLGVIPGAGRDPVPFSGARCQPGGFDRNLGRHLVELAENPLDLSQVVGEARAKIVLAQHT